MKVLFLKSALLAILTTLMPIAFGNDAAEGSRSASKSAPAKPLISKSRAADIATQSVGGKVLKVDEASIDGVPIFRVKVLQPAGRVKNIKINGLNGKII